MDTLGSLSPSPYFSERVNGVLSLYVVSFFKALIVLHISLFCLMILRKCFMVTLHVVVNIWFSSLLLSVFILIFIAFPYLWEFQMDIVDKGWHINVYLTSKGKFSTTNRICFFSIPKSNCRLKLIVERKKQDMAYHSSSVPAAILICPLLSRWFSVSIPCGENEAALKYWMSAIVSAERAPTMNSIVNHTGVSAETLISRIASSLKMPFKILTRIVLVCVVGYTFWFVGMVYVYGKTDSLYEKLVKENPKTKADTDAILASCKQVLISMSESPWGHDRVFETNESCVQYRVCGLASCSIDIIYADGTNVVSIYPSYE